MTSFAKLKRWYHTSLAFNWLFIPIAMAVFFGTSEATGYGDMLDYVGNDIQTLEGRIATGGYKQRSLFVMTKAGRQQVFCYPGAVDGECLPRSVVRSPETVRVKTFLYEGADDDCRAILAVFDKDGRALYSEDKAMIEIRAGQSVVRGNSFFVHAMPGLFFGLIFALGRYFMGVRSSRRQAAARA